VIIVLVSGSICLPVAAGDRDLQKVLVTGGVESVRINLNPWGPHLGFEVEIEGDEPRLAPLLSVISSAEPSQGHKCANRGAIRFRMVGGDVVAVGLLPSHSEGSYQYRLYDGDRLEGVFSVQRDALLAALEGLGVPIDDPAFAD
jgi:hypothetical protein